MVITYDDNDDFIMLGSCNTDGNWFLKNHGGSPSGPRAQLGGGRGDPSVLLLKPRSSPSRARGGERAQAPGILRWSPTPPLRNSSEASL